MKQSEMSFFGKAWWRFKRMFQKRGVKIFRVLTTSDREEPTDEEKEAAAIFRMTLKDPDSDVLVSPREGKYYIKNTDRAMLLILGPESLKIIKNIYGYTVSVTAKTHDSLQDVFLAEVEKRRRQLEEEFSANVKHTLKSIIDSLTHEINP